MKKPAKQSLSPILACDDLVVGYQAGKPIINKVNLEFRPGQFTTLLGPNGAGKTTLLRTLSRHLRPLSGTIRIADTFLESLSQIELAKMMSVVLTDKIDPPFFKVSQFVALGRYPHTDFLGRLRQHDREIVTQVLQAVQADELKDRDFTTLSDGERQKVLVARALAQEPKIILLDEPTAHLDLRHRLEVMAILRNLCRERNLTVIASLHDVDIAAKVSDQVALIKDGAITASGFPEEILTGPEVARLYDFDSACFNHQLGSIELRGNGLKRKVFVVAGMGSGATLYRLLSKYGYQISTGVLHTNDLDSFVAESLGAICTCQAPANTMEDTALNRALDELNECDLVIDAGFDSDGAYSENLTLLKQAAAAGKPIFSLRREIAKLIPEQDQSDLAIFTTPNQLLNAIEHL